MFTYLPYFCTKPLLLSRFNSPAVIASYFIQDNDDLIENLKLCRNLKSVLTRLIVFIAIYVVSFGYDSSTFTTSFTQRANLSNFRLSTNSQNLNQQCSRLDLSKIGSQN